jgi:hypothetical protein
MDDKKYIEDCLKTAIKIMRAACDDAEHSINRDIRLSIGSLPSPQNVMHEFAWGFANASSEIESAMNHVGRMLDKQLKSLEGLK